MYTENRRYYPIEQKFGGLIFTVGKIPFFPTMRIPYSKKGFYGPLLHKEKETFTNVDKLFHKNMKTLKFLFFFVKAFLTNKIKFFEIMYRSLKQRIF